MNNIAFKRAKDHLSLHPDFITEWIDTVYLNSTEGYEVLTEAEFQIELSKNEEKQAAFELHLKEEERNARQAELDAQQADFIKKKEEEREYNKFKAWQRHNGKK